jgi:hypothetical protein
MFLYGERRSNCSSRAKRFEQSAAVERLEPFELNYSITLCVNIPLFHCFGLVISLGIGTSIFRILLSFAKRLDILMHTEFMEVEKEDDFRFDGHDRSKDRLT